MYEIFVKLFLESFDARMQEITEDFCPTLQENVSLLIFALAKLGLSLMWLFFFHFLRRKNA